MTILESRLFGIPLWVLGLVVVGGVGLAWYLKRRAGSTTTSTLGQAPTQAAPNYDYSQIDPYTQTPYSVEQQTNPNTGLPNYYNPSTTTSPAPAAPSTQIRPMDTSGQFAYWDTQNPQGVPIRPSPGSTQVTGYAPYGSPIQIASYGAQYAQYGGQGAYQQYLPVQGGGYIAGVDVVQPGQGSPTGPAMGRAAGPRTQATPYWPVAYDLEALRN